MLRFAGHPIVMANHSGDLPTDGWHKTLSNDEDGVAIAVESRVLASGNN
jgi:hypothetical protein